MPYANVINGGTWTPVLTFATPGNLAVTYSTQTGVWRQMGDLIFARFSIVTSAFTHTTASGDAIISGLALTSGTGLGGNVIWRGITKANYTQVMPNPGSAATTIRLLASGSGQVLTNVAAADMPTGGTVQLTGFVFFTL
jgi:hypothetical protein